MKRICLAFLLSAIVVSATSTLGQIVHRGDVERFNDLVEATNTTIDLNEKLARMRLDHADDVMVIALLRADAAVEKAGEFCTRRP